MLNHIRIVLIETSHPGNIGAVARAMKNMRLSRLCLVNPAGYPCAEATSRASGADDLLQRAQVYDSLDRALEGCRLVLGASARLRSVQWPQIDPRACAATVLEEAGVGGEVALLFGRESSGLRNSELDRCHYLVHIPANPDYASLNLSQAVQVLAYELNMRALAIEEGAAVVSPTSTPAAEAEAMEGFFAHLEQALLDIGYADPKQSQRLQRRLRRLFFRARPDSDELNILRGILRAAQGGKALRAARNRGGAQGE
ncbi:MAG: RNA methyltransferase [Candidatus Sedimenticola endophacoides]